MEGTGANFDASKAGESTPKTEFTEMKRLVRKSSDEVVAVLPGQVDFVQRYSVGGLAKAIADTEGVDAAHEYASGAIDTLKMRPADAFGVWVDLVKKGDEKALAKARRAVGVAGEDVTFLEDIGVVELGGLHSAERLVELVEAGDKESIDVARGITRNVYVVDRAALFGKLYRAGDAESLDLALEAAREAKGYTERTGDQHYHRSDRALYDMASFAIQDGKVDDALRLMDAIEDESSKASLNIQLFSKGRTESLQPTLDYLATASKYSAESHERSLAEAGYAPALEAVRHRTEGEVKGHDNLGRIYDLIALYKSGDQSAAQKVAELVRSKQDIVDCHYMINVGLRDEAIVLAKEIYEADPSPKNARGLLELHHDNELWQKVFDHTLKERNDPWQASQWVTNLGAHAKALNN